MPVIESATGLTLDRIILATDFKPDSDAATEYARTVAKRFSSHLTVAHIIDLSVATRSEASMAGWPIEEMRHDSAENMERTVNKLTSLGLPVRGRKLEAHCPAAALVSLSEELEAGLIIMGTNSRRGLSKLIMGSCAEGVIHHAKCPVVTIGPNAKISPDQEFQLKSIVFATELNHDAALKADVAFALAKESDAKVYICHVVEQPFTATPFTVEVPLETESALRDLLPDSACRHCPECIVEFGGVPERILRLAKRTKADLIVLGTRRGGSYFAHLMQGVVGRVLAEANCPVMTICTD
jgi:nucleotide-binding universal stress UspA family protein